MWLCARRADSGFSLIEVLVAVAVVASVLGAIGAVIATTVKGSRSIDDRLLLIETAQRMLAGLPLRDALQPTNQTGTSSGFNWRIDVAPFPAPPPSAKDPPRWVPLAVTLRVQAPRGPVLRLDTIRLVRSAEQ
jgi:general secretion pathway protein I